jgi:hypothetical protein
VGLNCAYAAQQEALCPACRKENAPIWQSGIAKGLMMDIIERITGESRRSLQEKDWPSNVAVDDLFWHPAAKARGSWRLAEEAEGVIDGQQVARCRANTSRELGKLLNDIDQ